MEATFLHIILDEAHRIKNWESKTYKACCALTACYRWTATGTPCQNGAKDYFSSLSFLRAKPYDERIYFQSQYGRVEKSMKGEDGKPLIELPPRSFKLEEVHFDNADHKAF
ncbi:hypothetical protein M407DRAFT_25284 [Tulasnella calospora MUT 4182]|uniref:SNF2 N-terminal domain-containing protein n=1 Tax=Tulasnella calospora MUT 4182 TaxID=1051891 RepID=A0A0C3QHV1_9AGAM|nr:hypothetical protein M407DRAFT_25284 [Tulasnella calospora MUT 4182]